MQYITIALNLLKFVFGIMKIAEILGGPGSGVAKKEFVEGGVEMLFNAIAEKSTDVDIETLNEAKKPLSPIIDLIAGFLF